MKTLERAHWGRHVLALGDRPGPIVHLQGQPLVNFASNDYLGLAGDERLLEAAVEAARRYGTGATGSRLLSGQREIHRELEEALAKLKQTEAALVFSSGYLANLGTIAALVGPRDLILADQYNHSSLKNGARLSGARVISYPHGDTTSLQTSLEQHRNQYRRCLILTDGVFSMDGDLCPLPVILDLAARFQVMVLVDDAHATGVLGARGAGSLEFWGCSGQEVVQVGTLSKALGSLGGFVAGSRLLIEFLRHRAATWIYSTGLSPADAGAALAGVQLLGAEPQRRERLWSLRGELQQLLAAMPPAWELTPLPSQSPILCWGVASPERALAWGKALRERGILAAVVRPPTVPTSRLRLSLMANHTRTHLEHLTEALRVSPEEGQSVLS